MSYPIDHTHAKLCQCGHASMSHMGWQTYEKVGVVNAHPHSCDILLGEKVKTPCPCLEYQP